MAHIIKAGSWVEKRKPLKGELDLEQLLTTSSPSFSNGLTETNGVVELGGTMVKHTFIDAAGYNFSVEASNTESFTNFYISAGLGSLSSQVGDSEDNNSSIIVNGPILRLTAYGNGSNHSIIELNGDLITITLGGINSRLVITNLPTFNDAFPPGTIWNNDGVLSIT